MSNAFAIEWQETGKPVVVGDIPPSVDVSLSHDGSKSLSSAGDWPQGCDIEPIMPQEVAQYYASLNVMRILPIELPCKMDAFGIIRQQDHLLSPGADLLLKAVRAAASEIY